MVNSRAMLAVLTLVLSGCATLTEFVYPSIGPNGEGCEQYGVPPGEPMYCETDAAGEIAIHVKPMAEIQRLCTGDTDPWVEAWGCVRRDEDGQVRAYAVTYAGALIHRAEECHCKRGPGHLVGATHRPLLLQAESERWDGN